MKYNFNNIDIENMLRVGNRMKQGLVRLWQAFVLLKTNLLQILCSYQI